MNKRLININFLLVLFIFLLFTSKAEAIGIGLAASGGGGSTDWTLEDQWFYTETEDTSDDTISAIGLVMDTNLAKDSLFNYRLEIGSQYTEVKVEAGGSENTYEMTTAYMSHDFGFAIIRKPKLRLWAGPELRFWGGEGEDSDNPDVEAKIGTVGLGPVVGLNINQGKLLTFAIKAAYLGTSSYGTLEHEPTNFYYDLEGEGDLFYVNAAIIFRFGDRFDK